jgi:hypothetical protein
MRCSSLNETSVCVELIGHVCVALCGQCVTGSGLWFTRIEVRLDKLTDRLRSALCTAG